VCSTRCWTAGVRSPAARGRTRLPRSSTGSRTGPHCRRRCRGNRASSAPLPRERLPRRLRDIGNTRADLDESVAGAPQRQLSRTARPGDRLDGWLPTAAACPGGAVDRQRFGVSQSAPHRHARGHLTFRRDRHRRTPTGAGTITRADTGRASVSRTSQCRMACARCTCGISAT
jgi:hypothetical protein